MPLQLRMLGALPHDMRNVLASFLLDPAGDWESYRSFLRATIERAR